MRSFREALNRKVFFYLACDEIGLMFDLFRVLEK